MIGLHYVLLSALSVEPRSGYALAQWLERAARHYWAADSSSIYPALAALERAALVVHTTEPSVRGPRRKVYALTPAGEDALRAWAAGPVAAPEVRDELMVKALCYDLLPPAQAAVLLRAARAVHAEKLERYEDILRFLSERERAGDPAYQRIGPRLTLLHGVQVEAGYVAWCDEAIALLTSPDGGRALAQTSGA